MNLPLKSNSVPARRVSVLKESFTDASAPILFLTTEREFSSIISASERLTSKTGSDASTVAFLSPVLLPRTIIGVPTTVANINAIIVLRTKNLPDKTFFLRKRPALFILYLLLLFNFIISKMFLIHLTMLQICYR